MSRKKAVKNIVFAAAAVLAAAVLEVCAFNFKPLAVSLGWRESEARIYTQADLRFENCTESGEGVLLGEGGCFYLDGLDYELNTIRISYTGEIPSLTACCDADTEDKTVTLVNGGKNAVVDSHVYSVLFRPHGGEGTMLSGIEIVVNDYRFDFSAARFFAMIAVCLITRALFSLQHPVDYGIASAPPEGEKPEEEKQG